MKTLKDIMDKKALIGKIVDGYKIDKDDLIIDTVVITINKDLSDITAVTTSGTDYTKMIRDIKDDLTTASIINIFDYVGYDLDYPDGRAALDTFIKIKDLVFGNTTDDTTFGPISVSIDVYQN
nr:MAG TPA: hypothetical protein [Caudoviricetes sp.]